MSVASTAGLVIGVVGGAVGLILGSLRIPALIKVLGVDPRIAAGTNMAIGTLMGTTGWIGYVAREQVDYPLMVFLAVSAMAGVGLGSKYTGHLSPHKLLTIMGLVMVFIDILLMERAVF